MDAERARYIKGKPSKRCFQHSTTRVSVLAQDWLRSSENGVPSCHLSTSDLSLHSSLTSCCMVHCFILANSLLQLLPQSLLVSPSVLMATAVPRYAQQCGRALEERQSQKSEVRRASLCRFVDRRTGSNHRSGRRRLVRGARGARFQISLIAYSRAVLMVSYRLWWPTGLIGRLLLGLPNGVVWLRRCIHGHKCCASTGADPAVSGPLAPWCVVNRVVALSRPWVLKVTAVFLCYCWSRGCPRSVAAVAWIGRCSSMTDPVVRIVDY